MRIQKIDARRTWDLRHRVLWPHKDPSHVILAEDGGGEHFGVFPDDGGPVTVVSVFLEGGPGRTEGTDAGAAFGRACPAPTTTAQFRKLATEPDERGKGYASALLAHVFEDLRTRGVATVWCNARRDKTGFYERLGMRRTPVEFEKDGQAYVRMEKDL